MEGVDNSKLKEMMVIDPDKRTDKEQEIFFNEFKNSTLLVVFKDNGMPVCLKSEYNDFIVPLFTDEDELEKIEGLNEFHQAWIKTRLLEPILEQLERVDEIAINPSSHNAIGMEYETFLAIFNQERVDEIEEIIRKDGKLLQEDSRFYLREEIPNMKQNAIDDIFTSEIPFTADFRDNFDSKKKYVNILLIPKGTRFLPLGKNDEVSDTLFAPTIKFKLINEEGKTLIWQCISQDLKYNKKSNKIIYSIIVIIIIILIIIIRVIM